MSGRGRGRGRAPPTGARLLLQRSAQEAGLDAGNLRNLQDITRPRLFPDYEWHSSGRLLSVPLADDDSKPPTADGVKSAPTSAAITTLQIPKRTPSAIYLINKSREMLHRFQNSPYYVRPMQEADVVRYSKRPRPLEPDAAVAEFIATAANTKEHQKNDTSLTDPEERYFPAELLPKSHQDRSMKELSNMTEEEIDADKNKPLSLEEMAAKELQRRKQERDVQAGDGEEDELGEEPAVQEDEEEDEVLDYTTNYYDSADEDDGGGADDGDAEPTF